MAGSPVHTARFPELSGADLYAVLRLRAEVFVTEQACSYTDLDGRDTEPDALHLWTADESGLPTAYARLLHEPDGSIRVGRVCTRETHRGSGLAARLVRQAVEAGGGRRAVLDAQSHLCGWYERLGFAVDGPEFVEDGIPHTPMTLPARQ